MSLISEKVTDLFGGVSQAPPAQRRKNQWGELLNSLPIYGKRLGRRPPLLHLAKLTAAGVTAANSIVHAVSTSTGRRAQLIINSGGASAYDADTGAPITVIAPNGPGSFGGTGMRAATSGDFTVITNPAIQVARGGTRAAVAKYEALLYVRQGDYSTVYTVIVDGVPVTYTTPDSTAVGALAATATDQIATSLYNLLVANAYVSSLYYIQQYGSSVYLVRKNGTDFIVTVTDGIADKGLVLVKGTIQRFTDLPSKARPGIIVKVTGDNSSAFTAYYVQYHAPTAASANGVWQEVAAPGSVIALDKTSLPYRCTFRGNLMEPTANVDTNLRAPVITHTGLGPSFTDVFFQFPPDALYPVGFSIALTMNATVFTYTVAGTARTAAEVVAGLYALILPNVSFVPSLKAPELLFVTPAAGFITGTTTQGFNNATTFTATDTIPTGLVGYIIENTTDGSFGTITSSGVGVIGVGSLSGGATNRFNDGDLCRVYAAGDYFLFSQIPWDLRKAGDDVTVPFPSLVGKTINEVFFHQGRLGLVSGSTVFLSRATVPFGLFRSTATQVLSDDPIDVKNTTGDASPFHSALEWNAALYLFSGTLQYVLDGGGNLQPITASTIRIKPVSKYLSDPRVRPVAAGNRMYFVANKSGFPRVLEYSIKGYEALHNAEDTGRDLPTYFQGAPVRMVLDETQGILLLLTDGSSQKTVYAFSYRFVEGEKVAAGWSKWTFVNPVVGLDSVDGHLAVLTSHNDGTYLNQLLLDPQALASYDSYFGSLTFGGFVYGTGNPVGLESIVYLDRRVSLNTGVTVAFAGGTTTWTLPYNVATDGSEGIVVVTSEQTLGALVTTRPATNKVAAVGNFTTHQVYVGLQYTTSWSFNTFFLRGKDDEAEERGRTQVRWLRLRYTDTSNLTAVVTIVGNAPVTYVLSRLVGTGVFLIPIQGQNSAASVVVSNSTPGAGHLVSYDWEGTHHSRERLL